MIVHVALVIPTAAVCLVAGWRWGRECKSRGEFDAGLKAGWLIGWDSAVRTAKEKVGGES